MRASAQARCRSCGDVQGPLIPTVRTPSRTAPNLSSTAAASLRHIPRRPGRSGRPSPRARRSARCRTVGRPGVARRRCGYGCARSPRSARHRIRPGGATRAARGRWSRRDVDAAQPGGRGPSPGRVADEQVPEDVLQHLVAGRDRCFLLEVVQPQRGGELTAGHLQERAISGS